jgi:shikimate dehydrogenase
VQLDELGPNPGIKRAAVLGHPIGHSLSPDLHSAAYRALGLSHEYSGIDVTEAGLADFINSCDDSWLGLSLTMPLKRTILPLLDAVDPVAEQIGAANTVIFSAGERLGFNTDVAGIQTTLREIDIHEYPGDVAIIGAGATAAAVLSALVELHPSRVRIAARRVEAVLDAVELASQLGLNAEATLWQDSPDLLRSELVVSTLPGDAASFLAPAVPPNPGVLLDVTYNPWPTTLAKYWQKAGGAVAPGFRMLLWQAAVQVELMTGFQAPVTAMWEALQDRLEG